MLPYATFFQGEWPYTRRTHYVLLVDCPKSMVGVDGAQSLRKWRWRRKSRRRSRRRRWRRRRSKRRGRRRTGKWRRRRRRRRRGRWGGGQGVVGGQGGWGGQGGGEGGDGGQGGGGGGEDWAGGNGWRHCCLCTESIINTGLFRRQRGGGGGLKPGSEECGLSLLSSLAGGERFLFLVSKTWSQTLEGVFKSPCFGRGLGESVLALVLVWPGQLSPLGLVGFIGGLNGHRIGVILTHTVSSHSVLWDDGFTNSILLWCGDWTFDRYLNNQVSGRSFNFFQTETTRALEQ